MLDTILLLPTGNEIRDGVVLDTDCPMLMQELITYNSCCQVKRLSPVNDTKEELEQAFVQYVDPKVDLVIFIGGSGEGHKYSPVLGRDCTHLVIEELLHHTVSTALYGKNGHMWSKLVCGYYGPSLVVNVPGPYKEAQAAVRALLHVFELQQDPAVQDINQAMAEAVRKQYMVS